MAALKINNKIKTNIFPMYPKINTVNYRNLVNGQKKLYIYYCDILSKASNEGVISDKYFRYLNNNMLSNKKAIRQAARLATVYETISFFNLTK